MDVQNILHNPDDPLVGQINEVRLGKGVYIAVFRGWDGWVASNFDCADLFSRKLAEGVGNFMAQGLLTLVGGGTANYNGVSKCTWDGEDIATLRCKDKINF